jgi:hypothetical protein
MEGGTSRPLMREFYFTPAEPRDETAKVIAHIRRQVAPDNLLPAVTGWF